MRHAELCGLQRDKADVTYFEDLIIERRLRDEHFAFMPGRGTAETLF